MPTCIYGLSDPRTGLIRYIGKASKASTRLRGHVAFAKAGGKQRVSRWVRGLLGRGLRPLLTVVEEPDGDGAAEERHQVLLAKGDGLRLLNRMPGGGFSATTSVQHKEIPECSPDDFVRFWSRVNVRGVQDCWEWKDPGAHLRPTFKMRDEAFFSSRIAYLMAYRLDPGELIVMHACDNPLCVNPAHLKLGTSAENFEDMVSKNRWKRDYGEDHRGSKLTWPLVREARRLHSQEMVSTARIASRLGMSKGQIKNVVKNTHWYDPDYTPRKTGWRWKTCSDAS